MALIAPRIAPIRTLLVIFTLRTIVILGLAFTASFAFPDWSPLGYDTSSTHLFTNGTISSTNNNHNTAPTVLERFAISVSRWDAIYFVNIGSRGYKWEQDWAFGNGLGYLANIWVQYESKLTEAKSKVLNNQFTQFNDLQWETTTRILLSTLLAILAHALSVIVLYDLTRKLWTKTNSLEKSTTTNIIKSSQVAFVAALLHILSPAGIFLTAPYNESLFSLLSFIGYWLYTQAILERDDGKLIGSGMVFGISCFARSNGILNGLLFLIEAVATGLKIVQRQEGLGQSIVHLTFTCIGGVCVSLSFLWTQYLGWARYCDIDNPREWCSRSIPMIYSFVQDHYWNVGFLRYWTFSNVPLFLVALPVLITLAYTSIGILMTSTQLPSQRPSRQAEMHKTAIELLEPQSLDILKRLALPQIVLSTLALTNYHIQIISRLSSGYVIWYMILAANILGDDKKPTEKGFQALQPKKWAWENAIIRWSVGYALVQAVLFGGFLPPA